MTDDILSGSSPEPVEQSTEPSNLDETAESSPAPEETTEDQESHKRNKINERFAKVTREKYDAINRAKELEEKYAKLEERLNSLDKGPVEPNFDDYESVDEYKAAYRDYVVESQKRETSQQRESARGEDLRRQKEKEGMERANNFAQKVKAEADRYEGFYEAIGNSGFQAILSAMDPAIIAQIQTSDKPAALSYHLANNLDVADNLARLSPVEAARELALIEVGLETPSPKKVSNAPEPVDPIGSGGSGDTPLEKISDIDEWMAKRNAQVINRR